MLCALWSIAWETRVARSVRFSTFSGIIVTAFPSSRLATDIDLVMVVSSPVPASVSASFDWMTYWNLLSLLQLEARCRIQIRRRQGNTTVIKVTDGSDAKHSESERGSELSP